MKVFKAWGLSSTRSKIPKAKGNRVFYVKVKISKVLYDWKHDSAGSFSQVVDTSSYTIKISPEDIM